MTYKENSKTEFVLMQLNTNMLRFINCNYKTILLDGLLF